MTLRATVLLLLQALDRNDTDLARAYADDLLAALTPTEGTTP